MQKEIIKLPTSTPVAPYSPAVAVGGFVFVAGQVGFDPQRRVYYGDDIISQTDGALRNLQEVLLHAGCTLRDVVKTTIYLTDANDFPEVNRIYSAFFSEEPPARSCVQVAAIPMGARIEIEAIAVRP